MCFTKGESVVTIQRAFFINFQCEIPIISNRISRIKTLILFIKDEQNWLLGKCSASSPKKGIRRNYSWFSHSSVWKMLRKLLRLCCLQLLQALWLTYYRLRVNFAIEDFRMHVFLLPADLRNRIEGVVAPIIAYTLIEVLKLSPIE